MKLGVVRFFIAAATAVLLVIAGSTAASAQCPASTTSPNYTPDFSNASNQLCLTLTSGGEANDGGYPNFASPASPSGTVNPALPVPTNVLRVLRLTQNATFTTGSAFFTAPQPVAGPFSTTFTFQMSDSNTSTTADGIAFVIQSSSATALDPDVGGTDGCSLGYGDDLAGSGCTSVTGGIPNSLAIEFDPYQNADDPNNNHVAIQSCGSTTANSSDNLAGGVLGEPAPCNIAINPLTGTGNGLISPITGLPIILADGSVHTVTITYTPSTLTTCDPVPSGPQAPGGTQPGVLGDCSSIDVILDGADLFPGGVLVDLSTLLTLGPGNTAWVGFTAATGGSDDNQDILSWTFTPQAETVVVSQTAPATVTFPNASGTSVYSYTAQLTAPYATPAVTVQPILLTQRACDALVQVNFPTARCFVYQNAENTGVDESVVFAVTCPEASGGMCGSNVNPFYATLGTGFSFLYSDNPLFIYPGLDLILNPLPGWVKWPLPPSPTPVSPISPPAKGSMSNQIVSFSVVADPGGKTVGGSGGGASYWVATYDMADEVGPGLQAGPGITITSPSSSATYNPNTTVAATYTCRNPSTSQPLSSPTGPYLTAASCTQATGAQTSCSFTPIIGPGNLGGLSCTGTFVTPSKKGTYIFGVTGVDSGGNQNLGAVTYKVN